MSDQTPAAANPRRRIAGYEPTDGEATALDSHFAKRAARRSSTMPRLKAEIDHEGCVAIRVEHESERVGLTLLMEAMATNERDFAGGLMTHMARASVKPGSASADELNFMLSVIKAIEPKDEIETLLAAQMAAIHSAVLTQAGRLANATVVGASTLYEPGLNKLARTFTMQIEALKRYRTGGEQKVIVEHVHVHEGGQAIVGHVEHKGEGEAKNYGSSPCKAA
jgi:hypothetical protein